MEKKILTTKEACILTGLSKQAIYKYISERRIPHYKPNGRLIYFKRDELEAWLLRGKVEMIEEKGGENAGK